MVEDVEVPAGWKKVSLEKLVFIKGRAPSKLYDFEEKNLVRYLTPVYLRGRNYKTFYCNINEAETVDDDVVVLWDGSNAGEIFFAKDGAIASTMSKIEISEEFHKLFFYYYLKFYEPVLKYQIKGSGIPHVEKDIFGLLPNLFPSLPEQRKIAEILETVDNAIEGTDTIIEKYKRIKQGLMQELLSKGIDENWQIRNEKTHRFKDSPLGRIPEEWEVVRLGEAAEITSSKRIYFDEYSEEGIPFYRSKEIIEKSQNKPIDRVLYVSKKKFEVIKKYFGAPETGDILITSVGTLGVTYLVKQKDGEFYFKDGNLIWLRHWNQKINKKFFIYMFSDNFNKQKDDLTIGTSQKALTIEKMKRMDILCPPLPEQHRIASILSQIGKTIEKEQKYKQKLESIKQGLMEDLLTGKVRVNHLIKEGMKKV